MKLHRGAEERRHPRYKAESDLVQLPPGYAAINVSRGGILVGVSSPLLVGELLELRLNLEETTLVHAQVVHCRPGQQPGAESEFLCGLCFLDLSMHAEAVLSHYLDRLGD